MNRVLKIAGWVFLGLIGLYFLIILAPVFFMIALIASLIAYRVKYPEFKGMMGERQVNHTLTALNEDYKVYHDLYVPDEKGGTVQVDHVVTSPYGIFVIETKNYKGWIFGEEDRRYWTQVIYKRKEKLYNPIWQNQGHVKAVRDYLSHGEPSDFHSIVVFSPQSSLKFTDHFRTARVIQTPQLTKVIREQRYSVLSYEQLASINRLLDQLVVTDKKEKKVVKKRHVEELKAKLNVPKEQPVSQKSQQICPSCGSALSLKRGKYGDFFGCSSFPKCKFTKKAS